MWRAKLRIFLIGDSIRLNSEKYVIEHLDAGVKLSSPSENCESSNEVKEKLSSWLSGRSFDLIHINCGLHDIRYNPGREAPVTSKQQYIENLENIFGRLSQLDSRVIWATSTPFEEEVHNAVKVSRRYLKDIIEYNNESVQLAQRFHFEIHDLYRKVSNLNLKEVMRDDGIHFNEAGNEKIGRWISKAIMKRADFG